MPIPSATALWDTVDAALTALNGITGYKAIVIISDGDDTFSRTSSTKVLEHAQQMDAVVHGVFLVGQLLGGAAPAGAQFRRFVEDAGGIYWPVRSAKDPAALGEEIAKTLSTRYEITFDQPADGKVHDISLRTTNGKLKVAVAKKFKSLQM